MFAAYVPVYDISSAATALARLATFMFDMFPLPGLFDSCCFGDFLDFKNYRHKFQLETGSLGHL